MFNVKKMERRLTVGFGFSHVVFIISMHHPKRNKEKEKKKKKKEEKRSKKKLESRVYLKQVSKGLKSKVDLIA